MACKVLVMVEHEEGAVREVSYELLGMAHRLAGEAGWRVESEVKALLLGREAGPLADQVAARGAGEVIYAESPALAQYTSDGYCKAIEPIVRREEPELVLFGHTPNGWDVAPLVAAGLGVPLATACSNIRFEKGKALFTRKAFNGKFVHEVAIEGARPLLATIDKGAVAAFSGDTKGTVRKIEAEVKPEQLRSRFVEVKKAAAGGLDLASAPIIVSGGRGVGAPEKLSVVQELAEALGAQLGASRAVTDAGWLPHEHQVGSSGVTVNPKLYIACGISGAIQHVVGMKGSGFIIAINKDPDAPIFGVADVGVVGDLFEYVPALTRAIREARS